MRYSQASRQESRLPASRDNSGSPNLMCGKCWHQNLEELQKANNRVPWLKRGHIKSLPSHGENRGSSPLGSANDFSILAPKWTPASPIFLQWTVLQTISSRSRCDRR